MWVNFRVQSPPSCKPGFGPMWPQNPSWPQNQGWARNPVGPWPGLLQSCDVCCDPLAFDIIPQFTLSPNKLTWTVMNISRSSEQKSISALYTCSPIQQTPNSPLNRSRLKLNYGAGSDFGVGPEFGATRKLPIIPRNSRLRSCVGEEDRVTWLFGLVNSTYFFKITNHNQHASNIKYFANLIKKYWTCFRYQKLADFLVCFPPSVRVQVRWPRSWKICLRIQPGRRQDKILSWYILMDRYKISGQNFGPLKAEFAWREWQKMLGGHVANWAWLSGFSPKENKISRTFFIDYINKHSKVSNAHNSDDCHGAFNGGMLNKGWSFSPSHFDCLGLMHFFHW